MLIKKFDNDANRRAWQAFLNTQGERLTVDGKLGPMSKAATERFQAKYGLTADGIVGEDTLSAAAQMGFQGFGVGVGLSEIGQILICVSAGHTNTPGRDQGVAANGMIEGVEAVKIRDRVADHLRKKGYAVIEDGADGVNDPLSKALVLARKADFAIEFHFNASEAATATGIEVLSLPAKRQPAQRIASAINEALSLVVRGDKGWKSDASGQHSRLAFARAGGLVVETCFATNAKDVASYKQNFDALCVNLADAIALSV